MLRTSLRAVPSFSTALAISRSTVLSGKMPVCARSMVCLGTACRPLSSLCSLNLHQPSAIRRTDDSFWKRKLHTPGDKEMVEFLNDEIKMEKENQKSPGGKLPKIKGFEIATTAGPSVTLTKTVDNESITIKFNVNNSIDDSSLLDADAAQPETPQDTKMVSKPSFVVEICKGGEKTLAMHCVFPPTDEYPPAVESEQGEPYEDLIEIQDVALLSKNQEWTEDVYSLSSSVMDGNLYDMLMKLLEERGVDADFIDQLTEFSTSYEHNKYIDVLEQLKEFAAAK